MTREDDLARLFQEVRNQFGRIDVFVCNARPEFPSFYCTPLGDDPPSLGMQTGGVLRSYLGGRPWAAMGPAKAALESLCRYFAVALGPRG